MLTFFSKNYFLIPVIIMVLAIAMTFNYVYQFERQGSTFTQAILRVDTTQNAIIKNNNFKSSKLNVLNNLYQQVKILKMPYMRLAIKFYIYGSAFGIMLIYFSVISGIVAFLLVKRGWIESSNLIKACSLTLFFGTSVYGLVPKVFKNMENTSKNIACFKSIHQIQFELFHVITKTDSLSNAQIDSVSYRYSGIIPKIQDYINDIDTKHISTFKIEDLK